MALFDYIVESIVTKSVIASGSKTNIEWDCDSDLSKDKKFIKSVNDAYKKLPLDSDIKRQFGNINTKDAKKAMEISYIHVSSFNNGNIVVEIHCGAKDQRAEDFLKGHSYIITMSFDSNYNFKQFTSSVEG